VILGDGELKAKKYKIKDMKTWEEKEMKL
jgi:histidyl-tRNA synthetase